jgi:hypothetical protein
MASAREGKDQAPPTPIRDRTDVRAGQGWTGSQNRTNPDEHDESRGAMAAVSAQGSALYPRGLVMACSYETQLLDSVYGRQL